MMLRGLWKLTWIEIKIFLREPIGAFGTIVFPVLIFLVVGRVVGRRMSHHPRSPRAILSTRAACSRVAPDRRQRCAVAGHHYLDLPRRWHPEKTARHAAASADDPYRAGNG